MLYSSRFFQTEGKAADFSAKHDGLIYSNLPGSSTREDYSAEAYIAGLTEAEQAERPFCVVWNIVDDGPIKPERLLDK